MELFSSLANSNKESSSRPIPKSVFEAVRVMGEKPQGVTQASGREKQGPSQGASPFLGTDSFSPSPMPTSSMQQAPRAPLAPMSPLQRTALPSQEEQKRKMILMAAGGTLLLVIIALVVWYFLRKTATPLESSLESSNEVMMTAEPESLPATPFAPDTTNFLMVDTETVTTQSFLALLNESGTKISAAQMTKPVEFLLTDKNNNPLAFSRFAYLTDLSLPEDLIAALGETFSIFLYNTDGKITMGLSFAPFAPEDMGTVRELVTKNEATLPFLFRPLLFQGLSVPSKASFRSGVYNVETVRYVNIDAAQSISFDYVMRDKEWIIGTSKDTLRAIIDKKSQP